MGNGGSDIIAVRRDTTGIVAAIEFVYFASRDTKNFVATYRATLLDRSRLPQ
jgi:hypothetical protein